MNTGGKLGILGLVLALFGGGYFLVKKKNESSAIAKTKEDDGYSEPPKTPEEKAKTDANEKKFEGFVKVGDTHFNAAKGYEISKREAKLNQAIEQYKKALVLKPNDATVKSKIEDAEDAKPSALDIARAKLKAVINNYKQNGKFTNTDEALFLIINAESLEEADRPSVQDIKTVLRNSNMVYYDGKVSKRMSLSDMVSFLNSFAEKKNGKNVLGYKGGFDSPYLANYTNYQLKNILANGWWFGLQTTSSGGLNGYTSEGGTYRVFPFSKWDVSDNGDARLSMVTIPEEYKGSEYSYGVDGMTTTLN